MIKEDVGDNKLNLIIDIELGNKAKIKKFLLLEIKDLKIESSIILLLVKNISFGNFYLEKNILTKIQ
jgi:hypothetical protein